MTAALRRSWCIAKKDIRIYYNRGPVIIFGILFPAFLFMAFAWGRQVPPHSLVAGLIGMALFFTSSATTPAVFPFETRTRTLERLIAAPVTVPVLVAGDVIAALLYGVFLSLIPVVISLGVIGTPVQSPLLLAVAIVLSAFCFAVLGSLFSTPPTDNASSIMTISNLVRLPLIFVSGIFQPVTQMAPWFKGVAALSPLTYTTEAVRSAFGQSVAFPPWVCLLALVGFGVGLWVLTITLHRRNMLRRLSL